MNDPLGNNAEYHIGDVYVPPFKPPALATLKPELRDRLRMVEADLADKRGTDPLAAIRKIHNSARQDIKSRVEELQHPLSPYLNFMDGGVQKSRTSSTEITIAQSVASAQSTGILGALDATIELIAVSQKRMRSKEVGTNKDKFGNRGIYPPPHMIPSLIENLDRAIQECEDSSPLWAAILAFSGVNAIHPFEDGNGRAARILFNVIMLRNVKGCFYLPIIEIWEISRGGTLIKLRDALYNDNWKDLVEHFCSSYEIMLDD
ncbi:Fic family protein [Sphingomonas sp. MM-1]|uniref:Fic family protein n=1 Tax=Sphingomonas sp. MM-1 TaxID=745310 RepID=UPI0009FD14AF|nr:Fic family protein [Sphingomonas sp. MM-1]